MRRLALFALLLAGCPAVEPTPDPVAIANLPDGNPLVPNQAFLPYPSDLFTEAADTRTGRTVVIPPSVLPEGLDAGLVAGHDGFSRIPAMLALFPGGVDATTLLAPDDPLGSLDPTAPVQLRRLSDGAAHPVLAELDVHARVPAEQALIVRPHGALDAGTTYVVAITDALRGPDGPLEPSPAFAAARDGVPTDSPQLEAMRPDLEAALTTLEGAGVARDRLVLAWTFTTRSREQVVGPLVSMQEQMLAFDLPAPTITRDDDEGDRRIIEGTFEAPLFVPSGGTLTLQDDAAVAQGTRNVEFAVAIPSEVDEPRPVVLFGHGFFSDPVESATGTFFDQMRYSRMSAAAIPFDGFTEDDLELAAEVFAGDLNRLPEILDLQVQTVATFTLLQRAITEHLVTTIDGGGYAPLDGPIQYMGISNGGTQGATIMATSPLLTRGTLVVPGGGWTHMLQRASQWTEFGGLLEARYTPLELQIAMGLLQSAFDRADCLNYIDRMFDDRPLGDPPQISLHMAVHDSQVANLVTEWVARTMDVPMVEPSAYPVPGLPTVDAADLASVDSAFFVYTEDVEPNPEGNEAPTEDNGAHGSIRRLEAYRLQVDAFLQDGTLVQVCEGACDPD